ACRQHVSRLPSQRTSSRASPCSRTNQFWTACDRPAVTSPWTPSRIAQSGWTDRRSANVPCAATAVSARRAARPRMGARKTRPPPPPGRLGRGGGAGILRQEPRHRRLLAGILPLGAGAVLEQGRTGKTAREEAVVAGIGRVRHERGGARREKPGREEG